MRCFGVPEVVDVFRVSQELFTCGCFKLEGIKPGKECTTVQRPPLAESEWHRAHRRGLWFRFALFTYVKNADCAKCSKDLVRLVLSMPFLTQHSCLSHFE